MNKTTKRILGLLLTVIISGTLCPHIHTEECGEDGVDCTHVHTHECWNEDNIAQPNGPGTEKPPK